MEDGWVDDARAYDTEQARRAQEIAEQEYARQLRAHRERALNLAQTSLANAVNAMSLTNRRLKRLMDQKDGEGDLSIPIRSLPAFLRAAAAVAEASLNAEAQALSVADLLRGLDEQHAAETE